MPELSEAELFQQAPLIRFDQPGSIREMSIVDRLMGCRQSSGRDNLLSEYLMITEKVETFLVQDKSNRIAELTQRREELWALCRAAEDRHKSLVHEAGGMSGRANQIGMELSQARANMSAAQEKSFSSRFPNQQEISEWEARKVAAKIALDKCVEAHRSIQEQLGFLKQRQHQAQVEFADAVERLRAVDSELNNIRGVQQRS